MLLLDNSLVVKLFVTVGKMPARMQCSTVLVIAVNRLWVFACDPFEGLHITPNGFVKSFPSSPTISAKIEILTPMMIDEMIREIGCCGVLNLCLHT